MKSTRQDIKKKFKCHAEEPSLVPLFTSRSKSLIRSLFSLAAFSTRFTLSSASLTFFSISEMRPSLSVNCFHFFSKINFMALDFIQKLNQVFNKSPLSGACASPVWLSGACRDRRSCRNPISCATRRAPSPARRTCPPSWPRLHSGAHSVKNCLEKFQLYTSEFVTGKWLLERTGTWRGRFVTFGFVFHFDQFVLRVFQIVLQLGPAFFFRFQLLLQILNFTFHPLGAFRCRVGHCCQPGTVIRYLCFKFVHHFLFQNKKWRCQKINSWPDLWINLNCL